jgi:hypothetical protein
MLGGRLDGLILKQVRQEVDKLYITLKDPAAYERTKEIIKKKPECTTMFK